ncbi:hypothetical protein V6Z12_D03G115000 [Gossypium hirsutum]
MGPEPSRFRAGVFVSGLKLSRLHVGELYKVCWNRDVDWISSRDHTVSALLLVVILFILGQFEVACN